MKAIVLGEEIKASIDEGLKGIAEGRFATDEEATKEIEEWLFPQNYKK